MPQSRILMLCSITALVLLGPQVSPAQSDPRTACAADVQKLCAAVQPGGGRILACLKQHKDQVSDGCKSAVMAAMQPSGGNSSSTSAPASSNTPSTGDRDSGSSSGASSAPPSSETPASDTPPTAPAAKSSHAAGTAPASKTKPAPAPKSTPVVVLGERFVQRAVVDTQQGGMTAATVYVPENWHFESKIEWHHNWVEYPLSYSAHAENPENAEAYFQYPMLRLESTEVAPQFRPYDKSPKLPPGSRLPTGALSGPPQPPMQALGRLA